MENQASPAGKQPSSLERRLATIMMADVFGYSRMVGEAEERTIEILRGHRQIFDQLLAQHRGRVFNTAGDAILAEFPSAVEAVRCATEIQTALRTRNDHLPPEQRMLFRIGINLGDVIVQGSDLLGDGVNVAARIQTIAEPGGVCVSGSVYDQIQNKLSLQFRQLGEKSFKNISQPVRTFSIVEGEGAPRPSAWRRRAWKSALAGAAGVIVLAAVGAGYWQYREREARLADEARAADAKQQTERERAAAEAASREAALQAELKASRDALAQAEASKKKAEQERVSAEAAQREAKLQADLKLAKDAQQRAEANQKQADEAREAAAAALKAAQTSTKKASEPKPASSPTQVALAAPTTAQPAGGMQRFDGVYKGRMCNFAGTDRERCWPTTLTIEGGVVSSEWPTRTEGLVAHAKGKLAPDGRLTVGLDGYNQQGGPLRGMLVGSWDADKISATGAWRNNVAVSGNWTRQ
jgi:class 3 adenylate cyclase